jgi:hypothetical protein
VRREPLSREAEALWLEPLPSEEFERRLAEARRELEGEERENIDSLLAWFRRRYPTPKERLAYARRRYEAWVRAASYARSRG